MNIPIVAKQNLATKGLEPCEPLHKRTPTRDENRNRLVDFMMFRAKFKNRLPEEIEKIVSDYCKN